MATHDFNKKLKESYNGTEELIEYYKKDKELVSIEDSKRGQDADVDLIHIHSPELILEYNKRKNNKLYTPIEVKVCLKGQYTGNFFLETLSNQTKGTPGCFLTTRSKELWYYLQKTKKLYIFDTQLLKKWIKRNLIKVDLLDKKGNVVVKGNPLLELDVKGNILYKEGGEIKYRVKRPETKFVNGSYFTVGYVVPIKELCTLLNIKPYTLI